MSTDSSPTKNKRWWPGVILEGVALGCVLMTSSACASRPPPAHQSSAIAKHTAHIDINAPVSSLWSAIVDVEAYDEWNPWLIAAEGRMEEGAQVDATVVLDGRSRHAKHIVTIVDPYHRLCWRDAGWTALFVHARRCRTLVPLSPTATQLVQELTIDGPAYRAAARRYGEAMQTGLDRETQALKRRAQSLRIIESH